MNVLDCETYPIASGYAAPLIVATVDGDGIHTRDGYAPRVGALAEGFCGHNVAYDAACMVTTYGDHARRAIFSAYENGLVRDTRLAARLYDFATTGQEAGGKSPYALANTHARMCAGKPHKEQGQKDGDGWRLRYGELDGVPVSQWPDAARDYVTEDYRTTRELHERIPEQKDEREQAKYYFALQLMSAWGIRPDPERVARYEAGLVDAIDATESTLADAGLLVPKHKKKRPSPLKRSMAAIRDRVASAYREKGERVPETEKGAVATGADILEASGDGLLDVLALYQSARASYDRELRLMRGNMHGVHTFYDLQSTGRTGSSGPNLQNMRRSGIDFRKYPFVGRNDKVPGSRYAFAPRPGYVWLHFDYPALELRAWAQVLIALGCGDTLAKALNDGIDPHTALAADIVGCSYDEGLARRAAGDETFDAARQAAKAANFGFLGGMGPRAFVDYAWSNYRVRVTFAQAQRLKAAWSRRWPESRRYADVVGAYLRANGATIEQYRSGRVRAGCSFPAGCNTLFQGLGGDVTKDTVWEMTRECFADHGALRGAHLALFVHDEILLETPRECIDLHAGTLESIVRDVWPRWIPDVHLGDLGIAATTFWNKAAKRITDDAGRLQVWEG